MENQTHELLVPKINLDELVTYRIKKEATFKFKGETHPPFSRTYSIELKKIGANLYEVFYPQGLLFASKRFEKLEAYFPTLKLAQNSILYFSMDEDDEIELKNLATLRTKLLRNFEKLLEQITETKERELIESMLENETSVADLEKSFLEDLEYMFYYHGLEKEDNCFVDYLPPETKLEAVANKALKRIGVGLSSVDLARFDFMDELDFRVQSLSGIDTLSKSMRHDFEAIRVAFLSGDFDFDAYQDICLHFRTHLFDGDNILEQFTFRSKIDSGDLERVREVEIVRMV